MEGVNSEFVAAWDVLDAEEANTSQDMLSECSSNHSFYSLEEYGDKNQSSISANNLQYNSAELHDQFEVQGGDDATNQEDIQSQEQSHLHRVEDSGISCLTNEYSIERTLAVSSIDNINETESLEKTDEVSDETQARFFKEYPEVEFKKYDIEIPGTALKSFVFISLEQNNQAFENSAENRHKFKLTLTALAEFLQFCYEFVDDDCVDSEFRNRGGFDFGKWREAMNSRNDSESSIGSNCKGSCEQEDILLKEEVESENQEQMLLGNKSLGEIILSSDFLINDTREKKKKPKPLVVRKIITAFENILKEKPQPKTDSKSDSARKSVEKALVAGKVSGNPFKRLVRNVIKAEKKATANGKKSDNNDANGETNTSKMNDMESTNGEDICFKDSVVSETSSSTAIQGPTRSETKPVKKDSSMDKNYIPINNNLGTSADSLTSTGSLSNDIPFTNQEELHEPESTCIKQELHSDSPTAETEKSYAIDRNIYSGALESMIMDSTNSTKAEQINESCDVLQPFMNVKPENDGMTSQSTLQSKNQFKTPMEEKKRDDVPNKIIEQNSKNDVPLSHVLSNAEIETDMLEVFRFENEKQYKLDDNSSELINELIESNKTELNPNTDSLKENCSYKSSTWYPHTISPSSSEEKRPSKSIIKGSDDFTLTGLQQRKSSNTEIEQQNKSQTNVSKQSLNCLPTIADIKIMPSENTEKRSFNVCLSQPSSMLDISVGKSISISIQIDKEKCDLNKSKSKISSSDPLVYSKKHENIQALEGDENVQFVEFQNESKTNVLDVDKKFSPMQSLENIGSSLLAMDHENGTDKLSSCSIEDIEFIINFLRSCHLQRYSKEKVYRVIDFLHEELSNRKSSTFCSSCINDSSSSSLSSNPSNVKHLSVSKHDQEIVNKYSEEVLQSMCKLYVEKVIQSAVEQINTEKLQNDMKKSVVSENDKMSKVIDQNAVKLCDTSKNIVSNILDTAADHFNVHKVRKSSVNAGYSDEWSTTHLKSLGNIPKHEKTKFSSKKASDFSESTRYYNKVLNDYIPSREKACDKQTDKKLSSSGSISKRYKFTWAPSKFSTQTKREVISEKDMEKDDIIGHIRSEEILCPEDINETFLKTEKIEAT